MAEAESKVTVVGPRRARDKAAVDEIRVPPHSVEAEQAVLGALMLDNRAWDMIADRLVADDFYRRDHQLIFEAVAERAGRGEPSDAVTLAEWLERKGIAEETGGLVYLAGLVRDTPSAANVRAYADAVRERSTLRRLISVGGEIAASAYEPEGRGATELVDDAERRVFEIAEAGNKAGSGFIPLKDELGAVIDRLDMLHQSSGALTGRQHRLQQARRNDRRAAEGRPDRRRRPALDGQDHFRAEHRRERRVRRRPRPRSASSAWKCRASSSPSA